MFYTVGIIRIIVGNNVWINPSPRYSFTSSLIDTDADFIILDNNDEHLLKMVSASNAFKLDISQEDIAILKHLSFSYDLQLGFSIDDNLKDIKVVFYTDN